MTARDRLGSVSAGEILPGPVLCRRLGWGRHTMAKARRDGLGPWLRYGRGLYVRGVDVIRFFERLADEQASGDGGHGR